MTPLSDLDLTTAEDTRTATFDALSGEDVGVVVDLSRIRYLDSAGIRVLFAISRRMEERRRRLAVVVPDGSPVTRLLSIAQLESRVNIHATLQAAREDVTA